jgi:hypothetical protein
MVCGAEIQFPLKSIFTFLYIHVSAQSYYVTFSVKVSLFEMVHFCLVRFGVRVYEAVDYDMGTYLLL